MIDDPLVGVAVGEDKGGALAVGHPLRFLDATQQASGEVRHSLRVDRSERMADRGTVADGPRGYRHGNLVGEGDEAQPICGAKTANQAIERLQGGVEATVGHRAAAVNHDLEGRGWALGALPSLWCGQLKQGVDGFLVLDGDQVVLELDLASHMTGVARGIALRQTRFRQVRGCFDD